MSDDGYTHPDQSEMDDENYGYAEDDEVSTAFLAKLTAEGKMCYECSASFTEAHGRVTACTYCWKRLSVEERTVVNRASHPEVNKEAHRKEAKARKTKRLKLGDNFTEFGKL